MALASATLQWICTAHAFLRDAIKRSTRVKRCDDGDAQDRHEQIEYKQRRLASNVERNKHVYEHVIAHPSNPSVHLVATTCFICKYICNSGNAHQLHRVVPYHTNQGDPGTVINKWIDFKYVGIILFLLLSINRFVHVRFTYSMCIMVLHSLFRPMRRRIFAIIFDFILSIRFACLLRTDIYWIVNCAVAAASNTRYNLRNIINSILTDSVLLWSIFSFVITHLPIIIISLAQIWTIRPSGDTFIATHRYMCLSIIIFEHFIYRLTYECAVRV